DVHRVLRRLALEPVRVELGLSPSACSQKRLVENLLPGERRWLRAENLHHRVAEDLWRAPLTAVTEAPVDARQALDDRHGPQRVAGYAVALVLGGGADRHSGA